MNIVIFLGLIFSFNEAVAAVRTCNYGGYNFIGNEYSDKYTPIVKNDLSACSDPLLVANAEKLNQEYIANNKKVKALALKIVDDPLCLMGKDIVRKYLDKSKIIEGIIKTKGQDRYDTLKEIQNRPKFEMQTHFVYAGLYNASCSNEDHRMFSILDLETINELLALKIEPPATVVTKQSQHVEDCANVSAFGSNELTDFTVSMKNGTQDFLFYFDPYAVPDQVIVTNQKNIVLYDSGCNSNNPPPFKLTLGAPQNSNVSVKIINNCDHNFAEINSYWQFKLKCQSRGVSPCSAQLLELAELLKKEVALLKKILGHYDLERQCFLSYGEKIWEDLLDTGLIEGGVTSSTINLCSILDTECESKIKNMKIAERKNLDPMISTLRTTEVKESLNTPKTKVLECPDKLAEDASLFQRLSWTYCKVGVKKLGLED